LDLYYCQFI